MEQSAKEKPALLIIDMVKKDGFIFTNFVTTQESEFRSQNTE